MPLLEEVTDRLHLEVEVVLVDLGAHLDLLEGLDLLLLSGVLLLLLELVAILAVIHDPANGRLGQGGDLHQVQHPILGHPDGLSRIDLSDLHPVLVHQQHLRRGDLLIDPRRILFGPGEYNASPP